MIKAWKVFQLHLRSYSNVNNMPHINFSIPRRVYDQIDFETEFTKIFSEAKFIVEEINVNHALICVKANYPETFFTIGFKLAGIVCDTSLRQEAHLNVF